MGHHGCSLPEAEPHRVVGGPVAKHRMGCEERHRKVIVQEARRMGTVVQEVHRTEMVQVVRRMGTAAQEVHRMGTVVREVHRMETAQEARRREKELGVHRTATELEGVRRKVMAQEGEHHGGLKAEGLKA